MPYRKDIYRALIVNNHTDLTQRRRQFCSFVQVNLRSSRCKRPQLPHKRSRLRHCEVHPHRRHVGPQFDEHDPVRILRIHVAIVRDAAGFGARAGGVFHAQR